MVAQSPGEIVAGNEVAEGLEVFSLTTLHGRAEIIHVRKSTDVKVEAHNLKLTPRGRLDRGRLIEGGGFVKTVPLMRAACAVTTGRLAGNARMRAVETAASERVKLVTLEQNLRAPVRQETSAATLNFGHRFDR